VSEPPDIEDDRPLPVLATPTRALEPARRLPLGAPALAATGGFIAGVVTFVLTRVIRRGRARRRALVHRGSPLEIASSRSFLVDIHILKR
jgi:hypothetical protein